MRRKGKGRIRRKGKDEEEGGYTTGQSTEKHLSCITNECGRSNLLFYSKTNKLHNINECGINTLCYFAQKSIYVS